MNTQPLVCVCIPNYNNEATISKTLDSIVNQTYKNIIIKIFDNVSTDCSLEILKKYELNYSNIQVFQNETNIGGEANFTKCFDYAEGEYLAVFHSDDVYHPEIISKQVQFLEAYKQCSAVATHAHFIDENNVLIGEHYIPYELREKNESQLTFQDFFKISLRDGNFITCPSVMSRTKIIQEKIKFWDFDNYKTSADFDVWLRLAREGKFGFINEPLIKYRQSVHSYSYTNNRVSTKVFDMFLVFEKYLSDPEIKDLISDADQANYIFQYNKSVLSVNINRYLVDEKEFFPYKKKRIVFQRKYILYFILKNIFEVIKLIKFPKRLKKYILNVKVNGKWFQS